MYWTLIIYSTFLWLGFMGLYSLRNMSVRANFSDMGLIIGFATLIQKLTAGIGFLAFIIIAIIKSKWYVPFVSLFFGGILSLGIGIVLTKLGLMRNSTHKTEIGMLTSAIITVISLILMLTYTYLD